MSKRPKIPADIKRQVLIESGHRCAIPTCRSMVIDLHHIIGWEKCQEHKADNIIALCPNCHRLFHNGKIDVKSLKIYKANLQRLYDRFTTFEVDTLFELLKHNIIPFYRPLYLLVKRLLDANYIKMSKGGDSSTLFFDLQGITFITLTEEGREYAEALQKAKEMKDF